MNRRSFLKRVAITGGVMVVAPTMFIPEKREFIASCDSITSSMVSNDIISAFELRNYNPKACENLYKRYKRNDDGSTMDFFQLLRALGQR